MRNKSPNDLIAGAKEQSHHVELSKAKAEAAKWRSRYNEVAEYAKDMESQVELLISLQGSDASRRYEKRKRGLGGDTAILLPASDWHVEETVYLEATNGKNEYNLDIAEKRIERYYQKAVMLIDWYRRLSKVNEVWHPMLGDLITGYIHDELVETNSLSPTEACLFVEEHLTAGIEFLRKEVKLPIFIPTCVGNHGRTTQKYRIKTSCRNSHEWYLYSHLAKRYEKDRMVHWIVGNGYHNIQKINGRLVRFHHGDGMRYNGGVGGITIPVNKAVSAWDKANPVDLDVFGHFHTYLDGYPKWVSCGCLIGYSEFALSIKAEYQAPTQAFIAVNNRYGMTMSLPIFVSEPKRK